MYGYRVTVVEIANAESCFLKPGQTSLIFLSFSLQHFHTAASGPSYSVPSFFITTFTRHLSKAKSLSAEAYSLL